MLFCLPAFRKSSSKPFLHYNNSFSVAEQTCRKFSHNEDQRDRGCVGKGEDAHEQKKKNNREGKKKIIK